MSKKLRFRTPLDMQHAEGSQTLPKSARRNIDCICSSLCQNLSSNISLLVISGLFGLFVNTLTTDDKYSLCNRDNLGEPIEILLSKKQKCFFLQFLLHFSNLYQILNILEKKMTFINYVFSKLRTAKYMLT